MHLRAGALRGSVVVLLSFVCSTAVFAQTQRMFVASTGSDANPCNRTAPCRNFAAAVAAVTDGGEVVVLDSAGYGPVAITKGVSIVAPPGVYAGVTATSGDAISISTTGTVMLSGLTLNSLGASRGVDALSVGNLHVENCTITGFSFFGVFMQTSGKFYMTDSILRANANGVQLAPASSFVTGAIDHCRFERNGAGIALVTNAAGSRLAVRDSVLDGTGTGSGTYGDGAGETNLTNCIVTNWTDGVYVTALATATVGGSTIIGNGTGLHNAGTGTLKSFLNNAFNANTADEAGTVTNVSLK